MVGALGFVGQALSTKGFQMESAGRGTMALYVQVSVRESGIREGGRRLIGLWLLQIVFAMIIERIFFRVKVSALGLLGSVIVISSAIYITASTQSSQCSYSFWLTYSPVGKQTLHTFIAYAAQSTLHQDPVDGSSGGCPVDGYARIDVHGRRGR